MAMSARFAYFYILKDDPDSLRATAPRHADYWHALGLDDYEGGPFADRSGGLITFRIDDRAQATLVAHADPFQREGLVDAFWLEEWEPETN